MAASTIELPSAGLPSAQHTIDKPWRPRINPWIVAMTVTLATFMEVLDSSIANVALPHIAGGLGATQDEATWVLTAYLVANAVILPAGAYMTTFIGRKKFYMICVALFGISSAMCGLAPTLPLLVFFRILQGDEIRRRHSAWIDRHNPRFGPGIAERFQWARTIDAAEVEQMKPKREEVARHMAELLGDDAVLCLPTAPGIAPKLATPAEELEAFRARAFALLYIAGLARLPQISLPLGTLENYPLGLSLIAPRGADRGLLAWVADALS